MQQYLLFAICGLVLVTQQACTLSGLKPAPSYDSTFPGPFVYDISSRQNNQMDVEITLAQGSNCGSCGDLWHIWTIIEGTNGFGADVRSHSNQVLLPALITTQSEKIQIGQTADVNPSTDSCKWAKYLVTAKYTSTSWSCILGIAFTQVTIYYKQTSTTICSATPAAVCNIASVAFGSQKDVSRLTTQYQETQAWTQSADCTGELTYELEEFVGGSWIPATSIFTIKYPPATTTLRVSASPDLTTALGVRTLRVRATSGTTSVTQSLNFNVIACSPTFDDLVPNIEYTLGAASTLYTYLAINVVQTPNCGYTIEFEVPTEYPVATDQKFIRVQHGGGHTQLKVTVGQTVSQTLNPITTVEYDIAYYVGSVQKGMVRKSFQVTLYNPCLTTSLIMPSLNNMVVQVPLIGTLSQTFAEVQDSVSNANSNPALCPERSYIISTSPVLPTAKLSFDFSTLTIAVDQGEFQIADLNDYIVTLTVTYIPTIVNTTSFLLRVVSCEATTLENITDLLPMSTEALSAEIKTQTVLPFPVQDTVTLQGVISCLERTYSITTLPQGGNSQLSQQMVTLSDQGVISVNPVDIDLTYVGDHKVTVTVAYTPNQANIFTTTEFTLTIIDPCLMTQIEDTVILDLVVIQGNTVSTPFKYQLADTVSTSKGDPNLCGKKLFTLSLNQTQTPELSINSDQAIQFSPTTATAPGSASCSLLVTMEKYTGITKLFNFMCTTIEAVVEQIQDQVYYVGSILQIPFKEFQIFPEGFYALSSYTLYQVGDPTQVSTPLDVSILSVLDEKYFTLDSESRNIKVYNNEESRPHPFFNLVLTNKIDQFVVWTQFKVEFRVKTQLQLQNTAPTFTSQLPSTFTIDQCKLNNTALWSYKLPGLLDMEGDEIMPPEVIFQSDLITYKSVTQEFQQQSFPDKPTNISVEISVLDSRSAQRTYKFEVQIKICFRNITANISNYKVFAETIKKQQVHPQAQILRIRPDGLMTIKFSSQMSVPDNAAELQNATVFINETLYPALDIRVIPGRNSEPRLLKMNWTFVRFSPTHLDIQLSFDNPKVVSINNYDKDLIEMTIYGFQWFVDAKANFMEPGFKLKTKELPMLAESESASLMAKAGSIAKQGAMTILVTSVVLNILMAGPLQTIFDVVKSTQILLHLLLINVSIPATTSIFFTQLIALMTYKVFDPNTLFIAWLKLEEHEPLSDQYDLLGYQSKYVILNLGSVCFSLFLPYVLWAVMYLVIGFCITKYKDFSKKVTNYFFFDKAFAYVNETYFLFAMCASINLHYFMWDSNGDNTNSLLTIVLLALVVAFPIAVGLIYTNRKNQAFMRDREQTGKKFMAMFGQIVKNLNVHRQKTKPIFYLVIGMIRKLWLVFMLVFMQEYPLWTILLVNLQTIGMAVAASVLKPYTLPSENHKEIMNEVVVLVFIYHLMALTDLVSDAQTREWIGLSLCSVVCCNLVVNLLIVFVQSIRYGCKRAKMHWERRQNIKKAKELKDQRLKQEIADELNKLKLSLKKGNHKTQTQPLKGILKPSSFMGDQEQPQSQLIAVKTKPIKDRLPARVSQSPSTVTEDGLIKKPTTQKDSSQELRVDNISESDFGETQVPQRATFDNRLTEKDFKELARLTKPPSQNSGLDSETEEQQRRQLRKERAEFILNLHKRGLGISHHFDQRPRKIQQQRRQSDEEHDDFSRVPKLPSGPDDEEFKQMVQNYGKERKHRQ